MATEDQKVQNYVVTVGERQYDLTKCFPLTIGDWEDLETKEVVVNGQLQLSGKRAIDFILFLLTKVDASVTREEVRKLPMREIGRVGKLLAQSTQEDDEGGFGRPT